MAAAYQTVAKQRQRAVLQRVGKVDQHIAAQHQMRFAEYLVDHEIVIGERDVAAQSFVQPDEIVAGTVVAGQRQAAAGFQIVA